MWFIGVEVEQETSAPSPEKNPGSASVFNLCSHPRIVDGEGGGGGRGEG